MSGGMHIVNTNILSGMLKIRLDVQRCFPEEDIPSNQVGICLCSTFVLVTQLRAGSFFVKNSVSRTEYHWPTSDATSGTQELHTSKTILGFIISCTQ